MGKKDLWILSVVIVLAILLAVSQLAGQAITTGSWGLSFRQEGQPPAGPVEDRTLRELDGTYLGDTSQPVLYLTFDSGYENGCTAKILDTLKKHNVPAAFFLVGHYMEQNADLVRRMVDEGHIVGNHTMHHYDMRKLAEKEAFTKELTDLEDLFRSITGKELPKYYRPPQGLYSRENLEMAKELGYKSVFWSLAYVDWNNDAQPTKEEAFSKLIPRVHNGAVILLHSTSRTNAEVLDELLTRWKNMGYSFASIDALFA